jgi:hypothetical protein
VLKDETSIELFDPSSLQGGYNADIDSNYLAGHDINEERFNIRLANSDHLRESASILIKKMYEWRGYSSHNSLPHNPNTITLVTESAGRTVATMTLCLDTDDELPADDNFGDMLDELRLNKRRLCEPTKLAIEKNLPNRVFASMIHISYIYARNIHKLTDYVIEVNPRHVMFYKKMLGFREMGEERLCTRVDAPAVMLRLSMEEMGEQIRKFGGQYEQCGRNRTFYPYFFSPEDEKGITGRLLAGQ